MKFLFRGLSTQSKLWQCTFSYKLFIEESNPNRLLWLEKRTCSVWISKGGSFLKIGTRDKDCGFVYWTMADDYDDNSYCVQVHMPISTGKTTL